MLYYKTVDAATLHLLKDLQSIYEFAELRLVGGTSLSLQIGHRKSIDLDLFGDIDFEDLDVFEIFSGFDKVETIKRSKNINIFIINGVKVDFVNYSYPWLQDKMIEDKITLAQLEDIAAMKLAAITGRGSKKDFVDFYFLLKKYAFTQIIDFYNSKYTDASSYLAIKSLLYFDDADQDLPLDMVKEVRWEDVKKEISTKAIAYLNRV